MERSVLTKLCRVRHNIILWTREQNVQSNKAIKEAQQELDGALSSSVPDEDLINLIIQKLDKAYGEEESYWRQHNRVLWLQYGDRNTSYFHAVTRSRKVVNKFAVVEAEDGALVHEEKEIAETIASYYRKLFCPQLQAIIKLWRKLSLLKSRRKQI